MKIEAHPNSCLIIGAGIAGLTAARVLQHHVWTVTVLDRSSGVGGRMATRRIEREDGSLAVFDHGAQFFTARSAAFSDMVAQWQQAGAARQWFRGSPGPPQAERDPVQKADGHPRYCGTAGMTSVPKFLAQDVDVRLNQTAMQIRHDNSVWQVTTAEGLEYSSAALILTPPVPQLLALLDAGNVILPAETRDALENITYDPCIAVLALLEAPGQIPPPGALRLAGEPVSWIADNQQKGISTQPGAVTIHAGPQFSRRYWADDDTLIGEHLCHTLQEWLGSRVLSFQVARWLYSKPVHTHPESCLLLPAPVPLVFAGDAFGGAKVEGAALSGLIAAQSLLQL